MIRLTGALAIALVATMGSGQARDEFLYGAYLSDQDYFNSSGVRLNDACQIVQQDRANYHRFNKRDSEDGSDPIFSSREMRAQIPALCVIAPEFAREVESGERRRIGVMVSRNSAGQIIELYIFWNVG